MIELTISDELLIRTVLNLIGETDPELINLTLHASARDASLKAFYSDKSNFLYPSLQSNGDILWLKIN